MKLKPVLILGLIVVLLSAAIFYYLHESTVAPSEGLDTNQESVAVADPRIASATAFIVGTWEYRSTTPEPSPDEGKSVITYRKDGTFESKYDGRVTAQGNWSVISQPPEGRSAYPETDVLYLIEEDSVFAIYSNELTDPYLEMWGDRGNRLLLKRLSD